MNTKSNLVALLAASCVGLAMAHGKSPGDLEQERQLKSPSTSSLAREEVVAEMLKARASGTLNVHPDYGTRPVGLPVGGSSRDAPTGQR
jgi:Domain of unknown function (DUF4148)